MEIPANLINLLRKTRRVAVLTGAGVSAESGVPTFRDALSGLWTQYRPEELATPQAFLKDPAKVWEWYISRRERLSLVQPNPGHLALAEMEGQIPVFTLITQNVDGLHQRAGSRNVIELHGNLGRVKCFDEGIVIDRWVDDGAVPPRCPSCGGMLRPDVVWFSEMLPAEALQSAIQASKKCQVFFSIGTSGVVEPTASLPYWASESGAVVVEVNPEHTPLTPRADFALQAPSGEVLPELVKLTWGS
jgi:NAD-dependent deacetylase